jgi:hypothetical protein
VLAPAGVERLVLDRKPAPLFSALGPARSAFFQRLGPLPGLAARPFAAYATGPEELFWLAAVEAIFFRRRGELAGLGGAELAAEVRDG